MYFVQGSEVKVISTYKDLYKNSWADPNKKISKLGLFLYECAFNNPCKSFKADIIRLQIKISLVSIKTAVLKKYPILKLAICGQRLNLFTVKHLIRGVLIHGWLVTT